MRAWIGCLGEGGDRSVAGPARWAVAGAALCAALVFAWLLATRYPVPLHPDTARDLMLARSCLEGGSCPRMGPPASFGELVHGALWVHCLGALLRLGAGVEAIQCVLIALHALAAGCVFLVACRHVDPIVAAIGALLSVPWMTSAAALPVLWNPSLSPLPIALLYLFAAEAITGRGTVFAALSGLCFGMAIDVHMTSAVVAPLLLCAFVASCRRPIAAACSFLFAAAVVLVAFSRDAVLRDLQVQGTFALAAAGGAVIAFVLLGAAARRRFSELSTRRRVEIGMYATAAFGAAAMLALSRAAHRDLDRRYFAVVLPVLAIAAGAAIAAFARWIAARARLGERGVVVLAALGGAVALQRAVESDYHYRQHWRPAGDPRRPEWSMADVEVLARHLYGRGWTFEGVRRRLQTANSITVLGALAQLEPVEGSGTAGEPATDLLVVRTAGALVPSPLLPGWRTLDLARGDVALLRPLPGFLDRGRARVCLEDGPGRAPACLAVGVEDLARLPPRGDESRAYPEIAALADLRYRTMSGATTMGVTFEVGLVAREGESSHVISLRDDAGYLVERVDGWEFSGSVPGRTVVITASDRPGSITFSGRFGGQALQAFRSWFPDWLETRREETELRRLAAVP